MLLANNLWNAAMKALQSGYLPMEGILSMLPKFAEYISKEQLSTMVSLLAVDLCRSDFLEVGFFLGLHQVPNNAIYKYHPPCLGHSSVTLSVKYK